jgi:choline-sulfatase
MNSSVFIRFVGTLLALLCLLLYGAPNARAASPPNVLWICADDLAAYACGCYGGQIARTPHIDQLASQGLRFDRAYCNAPVCTASRQSFLTGRYPVSNGVRVLKTPLDERESTLAERLAAAGYQTAAVGKMHFNSQLKHGFEQLVDMADFRRATASRPRRLLPANQEFLGDWRPFRDPADVWLNSRALPFAAYADEMPATWLADQAAAFLEAPHERPFFLMVSFYEPHSPFHFPAEYRDRLQASQFTAPVVAEADRWQIPAIFRDLTDEQKQGVAAAYHTSVEFLDTNVGRVLSSLDQAGLADNTLVIFTGDHGYLLGQHGRFEKHCSFEPAIRAPLLLRYPSHVPSDSTSSSLVEFIDIVPTLLDLCDVSRDAQLQGHSLLPLLSNPQQPHRPHVIVEYAENEEACIRTPRHKLVYTTGARQRDDGYTTGLPLPGKTLRLYDLDADPDELHDLSHHSAHANLVQQLTQHLADHFRRLSPAVQELPDSATPDEILAAGLRP